MINKTLSSNYQLLKMLKGCLWSFKFLIYFLFTGLLIVVNLPWHPWIMVCFNDCSDPSSSTTNQRKHVTENQNVTYQTIESTIQPMDFNLENLIFQFEKCVKDDNTLSLERYILGLYAS